MKIADTVVSQDDIVTEHVASTSLAHIADQRIRKALMDALMEERFLLLDEVTTFELAKASDTMKGLFASNESSAHAGLVYNDNHLCFLLEPSCKQGMEWRSDTPMYVLDNSEWTVVKSTTALCRRVLRATLSAEAYAHPGVDEFMIGLELAVQQLAYSLETEMTLQNFVPQSSYEWFVKGERISSLRDRPFHPVSKAKVGYSEQDYRNYMAEFGDGVKLHWVAISNDAVARGTEDEAGDGLDLLDEASRTDIEQELRSKGLSREHYTLIPVHPWQLQNRILPDYERELSAGVIVLLDTTAGQYWATSSVRSFAPVLASTSMLKLPISVKSLGAARYLPVVKLLNGLSGERLLRQAIACDETLENRVFLCKENQWWGYMPKDMGLFDDHPRHLAAQIRTYPSQLLDDRYKIIPMSSLGVLLDGEHYLNELVGRKLSSDEAVGFYEEMSALFYDIAMRLFKVGIVPELHGQNCCLVLLDNKAVGLLLRDHDSVRLYPPYLEQHGIADPHYHIRPGYSNSLYNETIEKLIYYIQSLGTKVNLASIMETMSEAYGIPERQLWEVTAKELKAAVQRIDIPEIDRGKLIHALFTSNTWPTKLIVRPLLEAEGVPGAMPSGKGIGHNPFYGLNI